MLRYAVGLAVLFSLAGCGSGGGGDALRGRIGQRCVVQIRPDWLGARDKIPVSLGTDAINGATVSAHGKLVDVDDHWVVLSVADANGAERFIPREAIVHVYVEPAGP